MKCVLSGSAGGPRNPAEIEAEHGDGQIILPHEPDLASLDQFHASMIALRLGTPETNATIRAKKASAAAGAARKAGQIWAAAVQYCGAREGRSILHVDPSLAIHFDCISSNVRRSSAPRIGF